jgi:hypothetical protein
LRAIKISILQSVIVHYYKRSNPKSGNVLCQHTTNPAETGYSYGEFRKESLTCFAP